jgi:hypothetical protein
MIELLLELVAKCLHLLKAELPDCSVILGDIRAGRRTIVSNSGAYVLLCRMTALAILLQAIAVTLFLAGVGNVFLIHFRLGWPPFDLSDGHNPKHNLYWAFVFGAPPPPPDPQNLCEVTAIATLAGFVGMALFYGTVAKLSGFVVRECCPETPSSPPGSLSSAV